MDKAKNWNLGVLAPVVVALWVILALVAVFEVGTFYLRRDEFRALHESINSENVRAIVLSRSGGGSIRISDKMTIEEIVEVIHGLKLIDERKSIRGTCAIRVEFASGREIYYQLGFRKGGRSAQLVIQGDGPLPVARGVVSAGFFEEKDSKLFDWIMRQDLLKLRSDPQCEWNIDGKMGRDHSSG